jgi:Fe2+/Zn2+ uptake regulation proteins
VSATLARVARRLHRRLGRYLDSRGYEDQPRSDGHTGGGGAVGEKEVIASLLAGLGLQNPVEPLFMLEAFLSADKHLTAPAFSQLLKNRGQDVSVEKAAGALELFISLGFADKHFTEDGRVLYEKTSPGLHHDHIICRGCGRTTEFNRPDVDGLIEKIACEEGFCHLNHRLVINGLCPECRKRRIEGLPLAETTAGEQVMVINFVGPEDLKRRLSDMGLRRGARLKILGEQSGSIIALLNGCRLAMGSEMSAGIMVRSVGRGHCHHGDHHRPLDG